MIDQYSIEKIKSKKIFALEGNIGAGKTTILKIIGERFKDVEFVEEPVKEWQELGGMNLLYYFFTDPKRWGFSFEFFSILTKTKALLKVANSERPIIIVERSILSNKVFMDISGELGKLDKMEYHMLTNTYNFYLKYVYPQLAGIIYLDTPVDECIRRITKRNRGEECSIEKSYLVLLKNKFDKLANSSTMRVLRIDGLYDCKRDSGRVCEDIFNYLYPNQSTKLSTSL